MSYFSMLEKSKNGISKTFLQNAMEANLSVLSTVIRKLPGVIYWKDLDGKYLGSNDNLLEWSGHSCIIGKTDFDMPWAEFAHFMRENDQKAIKLNTTLNIEETAIIATGQRLNVLTRKTPLKDEQGHVIGIIGTTMNITNLKQHEFDLLSSQEKTQSTLETIVANMPGYVYWKDKNGLYLGCNNRQARSLGFRNGYELIGKTDFELPWGENLAENFRKHEQHIMETGVPEVIEENTLIDGKKSTFLSHKSPMRNKKGDITGVVGISIDISERKKMEAELNIAKDKAEAANRTKIEFLENMRHDIRTPLTGIVGFSEIIKAETTDSHIKEYAENLVASSHALLNLLDEVLEAIQVSSGEIPKVKKKFILENLMQHVINLNKAKALSKKLSLSFEYDPEIPHYLIGDNVRIHRILLELIANALNFTQTGFVKLSAQLAQKDNREVIIKFIVSDSGIGIPHDKQQEVFLQFKRLTPSYKGIYKGVGLGLSVIKQFIDELDGEIYVESTVKKGTSFTCILPLKISLLEDNTGLEEDYEDCELISSKLPSCTLLDSSTNNEKNYKHRILVVEDSYIAQTVTRSLLNQYDCQVDIALDGHTAIALWKQNNYDLVFMDIGLPDMDGYQVTRQIRIQEIAKSHHTPIIALTSHIGEENKLRCIESGMNAVISKPLTQKSCIEVLSAFIAFSQNDLLSKEHSFELPQHKEQLFDLNAYPLLDIEEGIQAIGSKKDLQAMLKFTLEKSLPEDLILLKNAYYIQSWEKTLQVSHKIKGGALYVGATRLKMACQYLECYWKSGKRTLLEKLYQQVLDIAQSTLTNIRDFI